ncbi:cytochrome d ubiquinol oxidase subunit II [Bacillus sp. EAC]|uniref:cytochrome d ubiquinol oxidase subunit II n=1 Tax=Bacillus sp. EAC TaxID=1978338 RepID=UPI000B453803|nr:cytochrome d ubiquinol oxidase subunit II [Bacillus sp. EAC]
MEIQTIAIFILWLFLYAYMIIASIDFGAGFYAFYAISTKEEPKLIGLINRHLSSIWELATLFFIFFFVGVVGIFPRVAYYYGVPLLVPGCVAMIFLAIRGSFYTFQQYGGKRSKYFLLLYGATSLLIPVTLSTVLTISEGGFIIENGTDIRFYPLKLITNFYSLSVMLLAVCSVLFISAMFLIYSAKLIEDSESENKLRKYVLVWSFPTIISSIIVFASMKLHNGIHFERMHNVWGYFLTSLVCFSIAIFLVIKRKRYGVAFMLVLLQYFFAFFGYGVSHLPYILYPYLRLETSFAKSHLAYILIILFVIFLIGITIYFIFLMINKPIFQKLYLKDYEKNDVIK